MFKPYKIIITVHSITKGECPDGFKVSDSWLIESGKTQTPGGLCEPAYHSIFPVIRMLRYGGEYDSTYSMNADKDVKYVSCPDAKHMVVFEIRRVL